MAEILNQSQIDAMSGTEKRGEMDSDATSQQEKGYRKYNFYQPQKFTKDRLKILRAIYDDYAKLLASGISTLLHTNCTVDVDYIEEQRYCEFSNTLVEGDVLSLVHLTYNELKEQGTALLYLNRSLILSIIDRMMGGEGEPEKDLPADYSLTDLEIRLYEKIVSELVHIMSSGWKNYLTVDFSLIRIETNPTLVRLFSMDESVIIVNLQLKTPNAEGQMKVCLPGMMLSNVFSEMSNSIVGEQRSNEDYSKEILDSIRDTELDLVGEFRHITLTLGDIYHLNVGDIIDLNHGKDEPVFVSIKNHRWFDGKMGIHKRNKAIKIGNTYNTPSEGDVGQNGV